MASSLRDRFFTRKVAHAITSPSAIIATGSGTALAIVLGGPVWAVVGGAVALAARVALAIQRAPKTGRINPTTLSEPWRSLVRDALAAQKDWDGAVQRALPGPLHDRLAAIGDQISSGVEEAWTTAQAGHMIGDAYQRFNTVEIDHELEELGPNDSSPTVASTRAALEAQRQSAERMQAVLTQTRDQLRLLNARLDEAVTRCIELTAGVYKAADLDSLEGDISDVTEAMEALRQAVDVTSDPTGEIMMRSTLASPAPLPAQPSPPPGQGEASGSN